MPELPSGTVTFLFTDIEGSTRLLKQLRDRYGELLAEHREILRAAVEEHGGHEIDNQGDAFFFAFRRARDAALAAGAAQRGLAEHSWPDEADVRVRMGMHTGEPSVGEEGYHGLGVHRAARISAAGHGGQILVSQATCSVLEDDELPGLTLEDLGEHRLKDLDRPERIHALLVEGLPREFPPLKTADHATPFAGKEEELAKAARQAIWADRLKDRRSIALAAFVAAAVVVGLGVSVFGRAGNADALSQVDANALGLIDSKTFKIPSQVAVGATPTHVAAGYGRLWVTNADDHTVSRVNPITKSVEQTISVGSAPSAIAVGEGAVWVANTFDGTTSRIDPKTNTVVDAISTGNGPTGVAVGGGSVWVANGDDHTIARVDLSRGKVGTVIQVGATELTVGGSALWASNRSDNTVSKIDLRRRAVVQTIPVGNAPTGIAFGHGAVWVANNLDGTVSRIDPTNNAVTATFAVGDGPSGIAVDDRGVWVTNEYAGTVALIDPSSNRVVKRISVGNRPKGIAVAGGMVFVTVRASGVGHRGGTLTVRTSRVVDSIDTGVSYDALSWSFLNMTGNGLTAFKRASGSEGSELVPNLAVSIPAPTDGGRTYTFQLRPNIRYSTGSVVNASDIRRAIERDFELGSAGMGFFGAIVGSKGCSKQSKRCDLSNGIVADDQAGTLTFHLDAPDPEFLYKLSLNFAFAVPSGTPGKDVGTRPLPSTGPYVITSYRPKRLVTLVRNKQFHEWSKAAQPDGYPDQIVIKMGGSADAALADVERGTADSFSTFGSGPPSARSIERIKTRFASRLYTNPQSSTVGLFLNTRVPPFDDVNVRRAVNYAVDRQVAATAIEGSPDLALPTCQILPPSFPGYAPYCPYRRNLAKAKALVAASGTTGMKVTVWVYSPFKDLGPYATRVLRSLGYRASFRVLGDSYVATTSDSRTRAQIGLEYWIADYAAASNFLNNLLSCDSFQPADPDNQNHAEFCDPAIDREMKRALAAQVSNPQAANRIWARVDRAVTDQAPWAPLYNSKSVDFLSERVGNHQYSPEYGMMLDQLWVR